MHYHDKREALTLQLFSVQVGCCELAGYTEPSTVTGHYKQRDIKTAICETKALCDSAREALKLIEL